MIFNRFSSMALSAAIFLAFGVSSGPAWCGEATQEQNLALLKQIEADLVRKPGDLELQVRHMQALGVAGRFPDELRESEILIAKYPKLRAAFKCKMFALVGLGNWSGALASMDRVKALGPLSSSELATRGTILASLGRYSEALIDLNESIQRNSSDAGAFFTRAECLFKTNGPSVDVVRNLEKTLKLDPDFPNAQKLLDYMNKRLSRVTTPSPR